MVFSSRNYRILTIIFITHAYLNSFGQIIADHTIVDQFDDIPQSYLDEVKKMWLSYTGESHSQAIRTGFLNLETAFPKYSVSVVEYASEPEAYTTANLRVNRATWGDYNNSSGWIWSYGEEDWWTNSTAISRTKAGLLHCKNNGPALSALGFFWCWDPYWYENVSSGTDPVTGNHWYGWSVGSPSGDGAWGLDDADNAVTGNSLNLDDYLSATQEYIDYCAANNISTRVFFTTGPVDDVGPAEARYQAHLKYERIREYVKADPSRILFDYADILCYNDGSETPSILTWNSKTFPVITSINAGDGSIGHIGSAGALRLAKAMWWMLARLAGWDGGTTSIDNGLTDAVDLFKCFILPGEIQIQLFDPVEPGTINLYSINGALNSTLQQQRNLCIISTTMFTPGAYIVNVKMHGRSQSKKIIIP